MGMVTEISGVVEPEFSFTHHTRPQAQQTKICAPFHTFYARNGVVAIRPLGYISCLPSTRDGHIRMATSVVEDDVIHAREIVTLIARVAY